MEAPPLIPSPYAGVRNSGPSAGGIKGKGTHIGTIKSLGLVHDLQDYIVSMETLALEQRRELDRVKEEKKDLERVVHKVEMHAEKLGLNTEWVQSMDLPPRLRSIVEDNKALKDKLRKYRLNNTTLEALMLQKETRLLAIADTNVRLRTQLLECARTVEDVDQESYLKQQITDRDDQIKALQHQLRVVKQKTDTDAKTFRYNLAFAAREKEVIKRQVVQAGVELEEKDRAYRTALLEIRALRRRLVPGRHAASNAFEHWGDDGEDAMQMEGDALNSSLDESAFRSTTENELFPLPEAEPSLRDPAYEPTQQSSESAPATSLSPTLSRELPPSAPELSPRPAGSVPTFLTQEARPSSEIQPGLQVPVPATSASADPGVPARPALDPIQEPVQVVDATSRLPAGGLSGDDQAAVAGVETQGAGQGGEGEGAKEEGVVGGEGGPGSVETTAVAAEDVAPAGARVSDGDAELGELQLRQEAAVIKIQASTLIARQRQSENQANEEDTNASAEILDAGAVPPGEQVEATAQDGTPAVPTIAGSSPDPPAADPAVTDLHTHLSSPQAVSSGRRPFNNTAKVIKTVKPNGTPVISLPARTPVALQPKKSLQALISPAGAKAAGRK